MLVSATDTIALPVSPLGRVPSAADASSPVQVMVTCRRPAAGWPSRFSVTVTAVDRQGCTDNVANTTTFTVQQNPTVAIKGPATTSTCGSAPTTTLRYAVASSVGGVLAVGVTTNATGIACSLANPTGKLQQHSNALVGHTNIHLVCLHVDTRSLRSTEKH